MSNAALNTALYSRLGGTVTSAGSAVFFLQAPDAQPLPYVVWDYTVDLDENQTANRTKNCLIMVKSYAASQSAAGTIDGQIDALLHDKPLTVTGYDNFWLRREAGYSLSEVDASGRKLFMVGSEYRVRLDSS